MNKDDLMLLQASKMREDDDLLPNVLAIARTYGWRSYHTHDSRRSAGGFPDLVLIRGPRLLVAELKSQSGRYAPGQEEWLMAFATAGVEAYLWRPLDWLDGSIEGVLRHATPRLQAP